ncbi:sugar ABC transporter ATP-binding protein [Armatimonas sp.]|uniref:sugar ABC transporter ATP-binding protein n=1 Tax=Armatimonas sp. TaxID=1872638 RepID=UPI00286B878C|nr:sugar ABC transporter ATP-binding protein [Armatimonas sp.]
MSSGVIRSVGVSKAFGGVTVLEGASVTLYAGEMHALVGENGAGKSTLAKIFAGVHAPTVGHLELGEQHVHFSGTRDAAAYGVALIPQEPQTFPDLSVAENIFIGRQPGKSGLVSWRTMHDEARRLLDTLGVSLDPKAPVRGLSVADRQMIELAAALSLNAKVLIFDETTASLTPGEVARLAEIIARLKSEGCALAFIGHRTEEVFSLCERITVLRDGKVVSADKPISETNIAETLRLMVGRDLSPASSLSHPSPASDEGKVLLEARNLTRRRKFTDISLTVHAGEIVGLAGLVGAGRTEVARALFGLLPLDSGEVRVGGEQVAINNPGDAMKHGLALVPEDRQLQGALLPWSIWQNNSLASLKGAWLAPGKERELAQNWKENFEVRCQSVEQSLLELSGGNQQKVVLSKWLATNPKVLILDEPTRGVDVGAKALIHDEIQKLTAQGLGVLLISSDLPEVLALADRILVMREGKIVQELSRDQATPESVIAAATGVSK